MISVHSYNSPVTDNWVPPLDINLCEKNINTIYGFIKGGDLALQQMPLQHDPLPCAF